MVALTAANILFRAQLAFESAYRCRRETKHVAAIGKVTTFSVGLSPSNRTSGTSSRMRSRRPTAIEPQT